MKEINAGDKLHTLQNSAFSALSSQLLSPHWLYRKCNDLTAVYATVGGWRFSPAFSDYINA